MDLVIEERAVRGAESCSDRRTGKRSDLLWLRDRVCGRDRSIHPLWSGPSYPIEVQKGGEHVQDRQTLSPDACSE